MDKGFLNRKSSCKKHDDGGSMEKSSLLGDLAGKIKNIDGKMIGKDGKPMMARRCVRSSKATKVHAYGGLEDVNSQKPNDMEPIAHTLDSNNGSQTIQSGYQIGMVKEIVSPNEGCFNSMVNDISSHTNDVHTTDKSSSSAVSILKDAADEIKLRFVNTLYGYSVGKRLAFPLVTNFVKHAWAKFGLKHTMSHHGMFLFQFETKADMKKVMEGGPWRINLVKMHNVPIVAYSKVGLDVIAAKVGKLIRLDAHTTSICLNSWGRSDYARALVEISAESPLVVSVDVEIPLDEDNGHVMVKVDIEYEWQPPRCGTCKVFDHLEDVCPKKQAIYPKKSSATEDKGKQIAIKPVVNTGKKNTDKKVSTQRYIKGYRVNNPKTKLVYRTVVKPQTDNHVSNNMEQSSNTTKPPSPPDSSKDGKPNYISDDISFDDVRKFINKLIEEELILEYIGNKLRTCIRKYRNDKGFI
ncbi:zinc knuckle CX2CX4HX4C containing protein [Tanacetum coccineum]